jgi:hypothetical protein
LALNEESAVTLRQIVDRYMQYDERRWANPSWWNILAYLPFASGIIFFIHGWKVATDIAKREQTTQGMIIAHERANHNRYGCVFTVNGKTFNGWAIPLNEELEIGKQVFVYYDPQDPDENALTDFRESGMNGLVPVLFMLLLALTCTETRSKPQQFC